jgi:hypothetical protein
VPRIAPLALALVALGLVPAPALAQYGGAGPDPGWRGGPVVLFSMGGGGAVGVGTQYTRSSILEWELTTGYDLPYGFRPEVSIAFAAAPASGVALRPGLHYEMEGVPVYLRGALDWSTARSTGWRWLLAGAGSEVRLTGNLGAFAEGDIGIPLKGGVGLGLMLRAGLTVRW